MQWLEESVAVSSITLSCFSILVLPQASYPKGFLMVDPFNIVANFKWIPNVGSLGLRCD
jgi:hypothetical protein